jgi:hypothetical protein
MILRYSQSAASLERAEELCETAMGRAFSENAEGVTWMGDVWGLLNQAAGKIATARAMLEAESGWDGMNESPERPTSMEALEQNRPPDFEGVSKSEAFDIGWLRCVEWFKASGRALEFQPLLTDGPSASVGGLSVTCVD